MTNTETNGSGLRGMVEALASSWASEAEAGRSGNGHPLLVQTYDGHARDLRRLLAVATSDADDVSERGCQSRNPDPPHQRCENVVCFGSHRDFPADPNKSETRWTDAAPANPDSDAAESSR